MHYKYRPLKRKKKKLDIDSATMQFIWDHATPIAGGWHCQFFFRNKGDVASRIAARKFGLTRLDNLDKEWLEVQSKNTEYEKLKELVAVKGIRGWIIKRLLK